MQALNTPHIPIGGKLYTDYEVSQMQRAMERNIRAAKRQVSAANALVEAAPDETMRKAAEEDFRAASVRLKAAEKELKNFCKQTDVLPDSSRVWVNGFGRSTSQKAVWATRKDLTEKDFYDILYMKGKMSDVEARKWYLAHDKKIPDLIDRSLPVEE